ncbi:MAG: methyltransferase domain-containing protein [Chitinophagales bacterium]|nr:methyltransferase domain-containing protein [Bacteroidota bacterium]
MYANWQKYLSYLVCLRLEKRKSAYNPYLEVLLCKGDLMLNTRQATYSHHAAYVSFEKPLAHLFQQRKNFAPQTVLVAGLGLGSVPKMLYEKFSLQKSHFFCVEIDPEIIALCKKYLPQNIQEKCSFWQGDMAQFVAENQRPQFDLIAFDIFEEDKIPDVFTETIFLTELFNLLNPRGVLIFSTLHYNDTVKKTSEKVLLAAKKLWQNELELLTTSGNTILIVTKN